MCEGFLFMTLLLGFLIYWIQHGELPTGQSTQDEWADDTYGILDDMFHEEEL